MFISESATWNQLDTLRIYHPEMGHSLWISPKFGATILLLTLSGSTIIQVDDRFPCKYRFQSAILSPFPNKIRGGKYNYGDTSYQLSKNDKKKKHAAHGLFYNRSFQVEHLELGCDTAEIRLSHTYNGEDSGYPFPYKLGVVYRINTKAELKISFETTNQCTRPIPYGLGFHPYFSLNCPLKDLVLTLPECFKLEVDADNLPSGSFSKVQKYVLGEQLGDTTLNDCFQLPETNNGFKIRVRSPEDPKAIEINFQTNQNGFGYVQLYTYPEGNELAIEPMTCAPDAFNNGLGLVFLSPEEVRRAILSIAYTF